MPRTTIEFSDLADKRLNSMTNRLGASSKAEVIRNALALYAYLIDQLQERPECELAIARKEDNRVLKSIVVPGLAQDAMSSVAVGD